MTEEQLHQWLPLLGIEPGEVRVSSEKGELWLQTSCPLAETRHESGQDRNPSFGFRIERGDSRVHCFSCGYAGTQTDLVLSIKDTGVPVRVGPLVQAIVDAEAGAPLELGTIDYEEQLNAPRASLHPFDENMILATEPAYDHPYVRSRVSRAAAKAFDIRHDPVRSRIVFPIRDWSGRLMGLRGRALADDQEPRYLAYKYQGRSNPSVWLGEHMCDPEKPALIVESVFDAARVWDVYPNVLAPLHADVTAGQVKRVRHLRRVFTLFDPDQAGQQGRAALDVLDRVTHLDLPEIKKNNGKLKDPADFSTEGLEHVLRPLLDLIS